MNRMSEATTKYNKEFEEIFNQAVALKNNNKYDQAIRLFQKLASKEPSCSAIFKMMGSTYWNQGKLLEAVNAFKQATSFSTKFRIVFIRSISCFN